jgi:hypothetical protein
MRRQEVEKTWRRWRSSEASSTKQGRCSEREDAEGVRTSREALPIDARVKLGVWGSGKPELQSNGSVLGLPLKRSRSPREDPGKTFGFLQGPDV